jgi:hypothetical protein
MDRERWRRIEDLYHAARSLPAGARAQFLASECREDESLRSEVESLIAQPDRTWSWPGSQVHISDEEILGKRASVTTTCSACSALAGWAGCIARATLGRDVALKLLPPEWTGDPDRLARLDREERLLASLNHPNIATIHGIEDANGSRALVLEFIEGDTLADRIARGPLPLSDALAIGRHFTGWTLAGLRLRRIRAFRRVRVAARWIEQAARLYRRGRPSAMARRRPGAAVHRRGSRVNVCFRGVRRHPQGRDTQTTLCIVFDQGAQLLRGRLLARGGWIDVLAVPGKRSDTGSGHGEGRLAAVASLGEQIDRGNCQLSRLAPRQNT